MAVINGVEFECIEDMGDVKSHCWPYGGDGDEQKAHAVSG